ncbi:MAG: carboxypeptidase-like regulatory domain-containing protein [Saprospiraceae bacterium]|nr:carboxypeptidase-like regulatory domain-containing protein [Saprospiraceae bacterium]MCF8251882.1 carboxypeptidase-like regulatory domain-containing protein [Saprospiraceae bacterium]MCF8283290.1 carboxypeptidase-like regulatory domain-containing protein [Bacteroidales bacterium]MCF8313559.1 carboxypeptidase-like regulatory domain-containing protein [Saprospiraceae bacterium]MCF8443292.1 carboxypeptidase-like regulatory domain-containing protein [Saprospiraceae bacterium]
MKHEKENKTHLKPLLKWLIGDANRHDEQALDASAQDDPFLADAIEGYRSMPEADHAADVTRLKARLRKKSERRRGAGFYLLRIAAVGAVLVAARVVLQQVQSSENAAMADAVQSEAAAPAAETPGPLADSVDFGIASQEKASAAADDRVAAVEEKFSPKAKKITPPSPPQADDEVQNFSNLKEEPAAAGAPPPVARTESKPAPPQPVDAALAIEETQVAPQKDEDLAKAKASRAEAKKQADSTPLRKPAAPAIALRQITGKVTDGSAQPLIGVSVLAKGTAVGTVTGIDGSYSINVPEGTEALIFTYIGFTALEVDLGKNDHLDVALNENENALSEVVITGLGLSSSEQGPVESPRPETGFKAFKKYVADNLHHPEADKLSHPREVVRVRFTLQANGKLTNFIPKGDAPQAYKDEAVRLLREGPNWNGTPGTTASYRFVFE